MAQAQEVLVGVALLVGAALCVDFDAFTETYVPAEFSGDAVAEGLFLEQHPGFEMAVGMVSPYKYSPAAASFRYELDRFRNDAALELYGDLYLEYPEQSRSAVGLDPNMSEKAFRAQLSETLDRIAKQRVRLSYR